MLAKTLQYVLENSLGFTTALSQHLALTFIALSISVTIGTVFGIICTRLNWLRSLALAVGSIGRTIPSLAVLALALPFLGIGTPPTTLALVFIGTLPILINTIVGIYQVDDFIVESARGMGMTDMQVLIRVELPIAMPVIMAGIRTSAVLIIADATLAAFIGGGGLGDLILRGHALYEDHIVLAGALPAALLAFYFEELFRRMELWATPSGLRIGGRSGRVQQNRLSAVLTAMLVMPLVFGALLPWDEFVSESGRISINTGIHPAFVAFGLPILCLALFAALAPRDKWRRKGRFLRFVVPGMALIAAVWLVVGLATIANTLPARHELRSGIFIQAIAVLGILMLIMLELVPVRIKGKLLSIYK